MGQLTKERREQKRQEVVEELQKYGEMLGRPPNIDDVPNMLIMKAKRHFRSWSSAKEEAGFPVRYLRDEDMTGAVEYYGPMSQLELATLLGYSETLISRRAKVLALSGYFNFVKTERHGRFYFLDEPEQKARLTKMLFELGYTPFDHVFPK